MSISIRHTASDWYRLSHIVLLMLFVMLTSACGNVLETSVDNIPLHELKNEKGAVGAYHATIGSFNSAFAGVLVLTGMLTDELGSSASGLNETSIGAGWNRADARMLEDEPDPGASVYSRLHRVRSQGSHAGAALENYAPQSPIDLRSHLAALRGYAILFLADVYCSGVPLSEVDFEGDFNYRSGLTTDEMYAQSIRLFDSAIALSLDSGAYRNLALIGKSRAFLARSMYDSAALAASLVDSGFIYQVRLPNASLNNDAAQAFGTGDIIATVSNKEGVNGLPFVESGDPRSPVTFLRNNQFGKPIYRPTRIFQSNRYTATLASWIEARLIIAEQALRSGSTQQWLDTLNMLRATLGTSGGAPLLAPLVDPGSLESRLDLMFDERGYWLFLTGNRQADLRRRARNDGVPTEQLYPTGPYFGGVGTYGVSVNLLIPDGEFRNPFFNGCKDRNA